MIITGMLKKNNSAGYKNSDFSGRESCVPISKKPPKLPINSAIVCDFTIVLIDLFLAFTVLTAAKCFLSIDPPKTISIATLQAT